MVTPKVRGVSSGAGAWRVKGWRWAAATAEEIIAFCRERLAHYKCPDSIEFGPLPKTSTGKAQKFVLRQRERADQDTRPGGV